MSEVYDSEKVYDEQISPLMTQIIAICREHRIPMVASFIYENNVDRGKCRCTTHLPFEGREDDVLGHVHRTLKHGVDGQHSSVSIMTMKLNDA